MNNRQEIAARLRETGEWFKNHQADIRYMACHIKQIISPNSTLEYQDVFSCLADIIDPTCIPVEADNNIVCSECGADLYDDDLYCSRCGARGVRDE